jgi:hypothetical protein
MKYFVTFEVFASTTIEVHADSEEQAREQACKRVHVSLCHQCASDLNIDDVGEITHVEEAGG